MWLLTGMLAYESILRLIPGHSGHHSHINSNAMILTAALAFSANIMWVCNSKRQMFLRVYCSSSLGVVCCVCKKNLSRDWSLFIGGGGGSQEFGFPTVKFTWFPHKVLKYSCVLPSSAINSLWSPLYTLLATTGPPSAPSSENYVICNNTSKNTRCARVCVWTCIKAQFPIFCRLKMLRTIAFLRIHHCLLACRIIFLLNGHSHLGGHHHHETNMTVKAALLHTLGDVCHSFAVLVGAILIKINVS